MFMQVELSGDHLLQLDIYKKTDPFSEHITIGVFKPTRENLLAAFMLSHKVPMVRLTESREDHALCDLANGDLLGFSPVNAQLLKAVACSCNSDEVNVGKIKLQKLSYVYSRFGSEAMVTLVETVKLHFKFDISQYVEEGEKFEY